MAPAQRRQGVVVKRLNAKRKPVYPSGPEVGEAARFDRGGIGFESDLDVIGQAGHIGQAIEHCRHSRRHHQRRRAAAKEDAAERPALDRWQLLPGVGEFTQVGGLPALLVDCSGKAGTWGNVAVEIAVGTLSQTKGPVDVGREIGISPAVL